MIHVHVHVDLSIIVVGQFTLANGHNSQLAIILYECAYHLSYWMPRWPRVLEINYCNYSIVSVSLML